MREHSVLVFRQSLFNRSETFIPRQMGSLPASRVTYLARRPLLGDSPESARAITLAEDQNRFGDSIFALTGRSRAFRAAIKDTSANVVHAHFGPDGMLAVPSARSEGVPLFVTLHGRDVTVSRSALLKSKRPVAVRYALQRDRMGSDVHTFLCVSDHIRNSAIAAGFPASKLVTHYIGVDTDVYSVAPWPRGSSILHVARLTEKKGTEVLLRAMVEVVERQPSTRLDIVGDGPLRAALEALARKLGVHQAIRFHGWLSSAEVVALLREARAFVLPSVTAQNGDREGLPISILEAMSVGTPVVGTLHSGIPEAISHGRSGLLVEERDVNGLAGRICELLSSSARAEDIGRAGAARVREAFDLSVQSRVLRQMYDAVGALEPSDRQTRKGSPS